MARFWNRWIGHSHSANRTASSTPEGRKRRPTRRRLKSEALEARQLLAANFLHNELMPEDVNEDGVVSALDALTIINRMGRQAQSDINDIGAPPARGPGQLTDVNNDGRDSALDALMVINRLGRQQNEFGSPTQPPGPQDGPDRPGHPPKDDSTGDDSTSDSAAEVQSIDGSGNNLENPEFGAAGTELLRIAANDYADGISSPAGEDRPSARAISNLLSGVETEDGTSQRKLTSFIFFCF